VARNRFKSKGRAESGSYVTVPHDVLHSANYLALSAHAVKLLMDVVAQFRGNNNGDLCASFTLMVKRGWRSRDTLCKAIRELRHYGLIELTRQGGKNLACLYALTWKPINECRGKVSPTQVASGLWRLPPGTAVIDRTARGWQKFPNTVVGSSKHVPRVGEGDVSAPQPSIEPTSVSVEAFRGIG
jgi:hypothetical protein